MLKLVCNDIQFVFRKFPIPHLVVCAGQAKIRHRATFGFDVFQIGPLNFVFNLHAYSLQPRPPIVNIFRTLFFIFFRMDLDGAWTFALDNLENVKKNRLKNCDFF